LLANLKAGDTGRLKKKCRMSSEDFEVLISLVVHQKQKKKSILTIKSESARKIGTTHAGGVFTDGNRAKRDSL
jgi:hypothetical protein